LPSAVSSQPIECWFDFRSGSMNFANSPCSVRIEANWAASLRGLLMDGYIAFYTVEADRIVIVRVVDGRIDIEQEILK
jgi:hypothetical protein